MLKCKLKDLKEDMEREQKRSIPWAEIASATGLTVQFLSNFASKSTVTNTRHLEALCRFFKCKLDDLLVFSPPLRSRRKVSCHVDKLYPGHRQARDLEGGGSSSNPVEDS